MILANLRPGERGHVAAIDWDRISVPEGRRLRELGLIEGAHIEMLDRAGVSLDTPVVVRIGHALVVVDRMDAAAIGIAEGAAA